MIGETDTGIAFVYPIDQWGLSGYRMKAIDRAIEATIQAHLDLAEMLAVSGAMRWHSSMRPEVLIGTQVRLL